MAVAVAQAWAPEAAAVTEDATGGLKGVSPADLMTLLLELRIGENPVPMDRVMVRAAVAAGDRGMALTIMFLIAEAQEGLGVTDIWRSDGKH